jgi:hypothetical protein
MGKSYKENSSMNIKDIEEEKAHEETHLNKKELNANM